MISYEHLRELQRFAELGRMSASLLHEISNPLTAALLNLELSDQRSASVRRAQRDIQLIRRYVEAARQQVRRQSKPTNFCVQPQLEQLKRIVIPLARQAGVQLRINALPNCRLRGDPVKFQHIINNLVINAIEAYDKSVPDDQAPLVRMSLTRQRNWLMIQVTDRGKGITAADLPHIFETFYSTKAEAGHGLGIGLAIVEHYVTADFGGFIRATSSQRDGTRFTVKLPLATSNRPLAPQLSA